MSLLGISMGKKKELIILKFLTQQQKLNCKVLTLQPASQLYHSSSYGPNVTLHNNYTNARMTSHKLR